MRKRDALAYSGLHFFYQFMGFPKEALEVARQAAELAALSLAALFRAVALAGRQAAGGSGGSGSRA